MKQIGTVLAIATAIICFVAAIYVYQFFPPEVKKWCISFLLFPLKNISYQVAWKLKEKWT